ncbi:uncharacterized protein HGUI_03122 [Hanseniaspora guilliermondii]|uniref:ZC3H15/TMA46 family C-terminal domain-containing protein n=1 Tax=Hanseniaspora guilliermondii TaxID=56406 RepID=A0A1L0B3G5_9ASCO|nr:uncharacterized protein HGUI_03122 [Hanseniaspora guilliermondii]
MEDIREQQIQELEILQTIYPDEFIISPNLTDYDLNKDDNDYEQIDGPLLSDEESDSENEESDYEQEDIDWTLFSLENHPNPLIFEIKGLKIDFVPPENSQYTIDSIENNLVHKVNLKFKLPLEYLNDPEVVPYLKIKPYVEYNDEYIESKYAEEDDEDGHNGVIFDDDGDVIDKDGIDIAFNCHIKNSTFFNMLIGEDTKDMTDLDNYDFVSWESEMLDNYMLGGTPMLFNIISYLKENFEAGLTKQLSNFDQIHQEKLNKKLEIQNAKFKGTPVTKENFAEWRSKFRKEMNLDQRDQERKKLLHAGRLTGKEIFEKGLANEDHEDG